MTRPTLYLLPDLGPSARSWDGITGALDHGFEVVALELPGSGDAAAEAAAARIRDDEPDGWLVAGLGAGARVAATVAAWAEGGERGLIPPVGLVLAGAPDLREEGPAALRTPLLELDDALLARPAEVARRLAAFRDEVLDRPRLPAAFARLIASDHVSARTRRVMLERLAEPGDVPRALSPAQRALLTAVLARVVPQRGTDLDLAGRIDARLAAGVGDGWRFATLPPDAEAWRQGLDTIAALEPGFAGLPAAEQDAAFDRFAAGLVGSDEAGLLTAEQLALWCTDVQAEAVRVWLSHPATQAWLRYDGFADGGDGPIKQGFTTTRAGEWEPWQRDWRTGKELQA